MRVILAIANAAAVAVLSYGAGAAGSSRTTSPPGAGAPVSRASG